MYIEGDQGRSRACSEANKFRPGDTLREGTLLLRASSRRGSYTENRLVQARLLHNADIDNIIAETLDDFKEREGRISKQPIQHWDVESIGFLKNVHPDVDVINLNEYLSDALTRMNKKIPLKLGLRVKTP